MHLVVLTARQSAAFDALLDRAREEARLRDAIVMALSAATINADARVTFAPGEVTATVDVPDADRAFGILAPVFHASPFCAAGIVVLRYGEPGAPERTFDLASATASLIAHHDAKPSK